MIIGETLCKVGANGMKIYQGHEDYSGAQEMDWR
jgi:hypothetical protein